MARLHTLAQIRPALPKTSVLLQNIAGSFTAYSDRRVEVAPVGHLNFASADRPGDCCVKSGFIRGGENFVVKVATGFYNNPKLYGLPSSNGVMLLFSQQDGQLKHILLDEGFLTDLRTSLAAVLGAKLLAPKSLDRIGFIGIGVIGKLTLEYLAEVTSCRDVLAYSRRSEAGEAFAEHARSLGFKCETTTDAAEVAQGCRLILTATPSREMLFPASCVQQGTCIIAMGADGAGKQELDPELVAKADLLVCDSRAQCLEFGEISHAFKAGKVQESAVLEMGELLRKEDLHRQADDGRVTIFDSTGIAAQDLVIAEAAVAALGSVTAA